MVGVRANCCGEATVTASVQVAVGCQVQHPCQVLVVWLRGITLLSHCYQHNMHLSQHLLARCQQCHGCLSLLGQPC